MLQYFIALRNSGTLTSHSLSSVYILRYMGSYLIFEFVRLGFIYKCDVKVAVYYIGMCGMRKILHILYSRKDEMKGT